MKKIKILSAVLMSLLALAIIPVFAGNVSAASSVAINEKNFPDKAFRTFVKKNFDTDKDNKLSAAEIADTICITIWKDKDGNIKNLKGIEFFTELDDLQLNYLDLENIDTSKNTKMRIFICADCNISQLDFSKNTALVNIEVVRDGLEKLNVSKNVNLEKLNCDNNKLTKLDVSKNTKLEMLSCYNNDLTSLDLTKNVKLEKLKCAGNYITSLDLTKNTKLKELECQGNLLKTLNLSKNEKLEYVDWYSQGGDFNLLVRAGQKFDSDQSGIFKSTSSDVLTIKKEQRKDYYGIAYEVWHYATKKAGAALVKGEYDNTIAKVTVLYKDVTNPGDFWFEPTNYLTENGVVKGYDNQTKFKPANECSRGQMLTFMWRLSGSPKPKSKTNPFTDIKSSDYFYKPVLWAVENGITTGTSKTTFGPDKVCTRAQTVTFLWRMAGKPEPKSTKAKFTDVKTTDYFFKATLWASEKKILAGYSDGTFKPKDNCLRRQMVTFLYKYDMYVNEKGNTGPKI